MNLEIAPGLKASIHFSLCLENGEVVDSNFQGKPAVFVVGDGNLPEKIEEKLWGLSAGAKQTFEINPQDGFGMPNPNNVQEMSRQQFGADISLQKGLVVSFADANKTELPGVIKEVHDDNVMVDFNHPLAGRQLLFTVEVLSVQRVSSHE